MQIRLMVKFTDDKFSKMLVFVRRLLSYFQFPEHTILELQMNQMI